MNSTFFRRPLWAAPSLETKPVTVATAAVRWSSPYVTAPQIIAAGLASATTLDRAAAAGTLVPVGRRGGRGPRVYAVAAVEAWLAGRTGPAPLLVTPPRRAPAAGDAAARIAAARGR